MMEETLKHESFGVIQISRINGGSGTLFGSSINHRNFVELRILPAKLIRELNHDWIFDDGVPYITVHMSSTQFAEAITSMNSSGTPVTIKALTVGDKYKLMEEPPFQNKRAQIDKEFEEYMKRIATKLRGHLPKIDEIITRLPKKCQGELHTRIHSLFQELESNVPYIKQTFTEQMDRTTLEAKGEVESFFEEKVRSLGLKQMKLNNVLEFSGDKP